MKQRNAFFRFGKLLFFGGLANSAMFIAIAVMIGGSAGHGRIDAGKYFVMDHGNYTEVSRVVFNYSLLHEKLFFIGHYIGLFGWLLMLVSGGFKWQR